MALVFVTQYEVRFDTEAGSDITWEVDILRSYDDADPVPSWVADGPFGNGVETLIGTGDPVQVQYDRDYDVYKPIQGSTSNLNLVVNSANQYENFSNGSPFEYQLRIRYEDSSNTLQPYWCGFFTPLDTTESVSTFPFTVSYTAQDGLGLLEDSTPDVPANDSDVNIFNTYIIPALQQTGLGLDVYVDSQLVLHSDGTSDSLLNATASAFSIFSDIEEQELLSNKEIIEGFLSSFNCKITQAKGRWNIYNASLLQDSTTWSVFNTQGVAQSDVTESLVYTIDGTASQGLVPANGDLQINLRRPYGSIECRPTNQVERNLVANGEFIGNSSTGWTFPQGATTAAIVDETLQIYRNLGRFGPNDSDAVVFTNSTGFDVDQNAPIELSFDWTADEFIDSGLFQTNALELSYQVYYEFDSISFSSLMLPGLANTYNPNHIYNGTTARTRYYWDNEKGEWVTGSVSDTVIVSSQSNVGEIQNVTNMLGPVSGFSDALNSGMTLTNGGLFIRIFALRSATGSSSYNDDATGSVQATVDNINITNAYEDDVLTPTFERVQTNFTSTYSYEPIYASSTATNIYQRINERLHRRVSGGGAVLDAVGGQTLEEIGTQLKLNDFRGQTGLSGGAPFKYYEGNLINQTATPLSNIDKVRLNWTGIYVETAPGIMNGGTFSPKMNKFDTSFYIPNQVAVDIAPGQFTEARGFGYSTRNINLVAMDFPGRSTKVVYTLAFNVSTTDDMDVAVANGLIPDLPYVQFIQEPGTIARHTLRLEPQVVGGTGYIGVPGSTTIAADSASTPFPEAITNIGRIGYIQGDLAIPIEITMPQSSEFEELFVNAGVIEFVPEDLPDAVTYTVTTINPDTTNLNFNKTSFSFTGLPGEVLTQSLNIEPNFPAQHELFSGNFSTNIVGDPPVVVDDPVGGGRLVTADITVTLPSISGSASFTTVGNVTGIDTADNPTYDVDVTFSGGTNYTPFETTNTFSGKEGDVIPYRAKWIPSEDFFFASATGAVITTSSNISNSGAVHDGQFLESDLGVTIGSADTTGTVGLTATPQEEPYSLEFIINNVGLDNSTVSPGNVVRRFDESDFGDSITTFDITISSNDGLEYTNSNQVIVDVNEAGVAIPGSTTALPESQFVVTDRPVVNGNAVKRISGTFPSVGSNYIIPVNLAGSPVLEAATSGSFAASLVTIPLAGGLPKTTFTANGQVNIIEGTGPSTPGDVGWLLGPTVLVTDGTNGSVSTSSAVLASSSARTGYWLMYPAGVSTGTPLDSIQISQTNAESGIATTGYRLTPMALPLSTFAGIATYTDGLGTERIISTDVAAGVQFCSSTVPVVAIGTVAASTGITCEIGTVSGGQAYAEQANAVTNQEGGALTFQTMSTAPTVDDQSIITFVPRTT